MTRGKGAPPEALVALSEIVAGAGGPLPAAQVLPLLHELADQIGDGPGDSLGFATVAYHALTGVDPSGRGTPTPAAEVLPGFPKPASEALMRGLSPQRAARPAPATVLAALDAAWAEDDEQVRRARQDRADFNQAMRELVAPPRPVPDLGTLDTERGVPEPAFDPERPNRPGRVRRRRSRSRRRRRSTG